MAIGMVRRVGLVPGLILAVSAACCALLLLLLWSARRRRRRYSETEQSGALLTASVDYEIYESGAPRDLNHRTAVEITQGDSEVRRVSGTFEARADQLNIAPDATEPTPPHAFGVLWSDVSSAEVLPLGQRRSMLFIHTKSGARYRLQLGADPDPVRKMLAGAGVASPPRAQPPEIPIGSTVRVRDGRRGKVVAVAERTEQTGHLEVFVRLPRCGVESWDSSAVTVLS